EAGHLRSVRALKTDQHDITEAVVVKRRERGQELGQRSALASRKVVFQFAERIACQLEQFGARLRRRATAREARFVKLCGRRIKVRRLLGLVVGTWLGHVRYSLSIVKSRVRTPVTRKASRPWKASSGSASVSPPTSSSQVQ